MGLFSRDTRLERKPLMLAPEDLARIISQLDLHGYVSLRRLLARTTTLAFMNLAKGTGKSFSPETYYIECFAADERHMAEADIRGDMDWSNVSRKLS